MAEETKIQNLHRVIVTKGEFKDKKAHVINIYDNTISVEFDDYTGRDDELQRTVIKHDDYEKIEDEV
ncbi:MULTISPECIES: hypothetical protein [Shouchella]|uniref:DUF2187 domain-containing protein n=3 Tax=Bacillaceae TaxID=186817 RepID=A0A060M2D8_9BACI|nr:MULTISPECIES: hypothetical protein [Bacillaceae]RQW18807.1 hypothetical protein EH196_17750 [Bacillus sp. C1-1]AIC96195.1 hypothetical protein BleG1_3648 [Shouchella lehensis G1]KQL58764.1 hypothetical protein AN965_02005 [Alkalicoccobacillus plakortidis]MBG9785092.1 hypothetical protein [Shouchella lehensis]TES46526.1 hypothetical protein E2L03_17685 [Shouchella lehensis]